jgi:hypothetical protein
LPPSIRQDLGMAAAGSVQLASAAGEFATERGPLGRYPATDRCGKTDHSNRDDAEKYGVFDQRGALFILTDLVE